MNRFIQYFRTTLRRFPSRPNPPRRYPVAVRENLFSFRRELRRDVYRELQALQLVTRRNKHRGTAVGTR